MVVILITMNLIKMELIKKIILAFLKSIFYKASHFFLSKLSYGAKVQVFKTLLNELDNPEKGQITKTSHDNSDNPKISFINEMTYLEKEKLFGRLLENLSELNGSSVYNVSIFGTYYRVINTYLSSFSNINVLEIGPGINLGPGILLTLNRVKKYYGVDVYKDPNFNHPATLYSMDQLFKRFPTLIQEPVENVLSKKNGKFVLNQDRVKYLSPYYSSNLPIKDNYLDFLYSHAAFEHFVTPKETITEIHRVLKPGGIIAHQIDLRDHRDNAKPLEFLKLDAKEWRSQFTDENIHVYTNRWRVNDYKEAFEEAGFTILEIEPQNPTNYKVTEAQRRTFHKDFQKYSLDELSVLSFFIVARKR